MASQAVMHVGVLSVLSGLRCFAWRVLYSVVAPSSTGFSESIFFHYYYYFL
jgi:hypothetical protein